MKTNKLITFSILLVTGILTITSCGYYYDPNIIPPEYYESNSSSESESNNESGNSEEESEVNSESKETYDTKIVSFEAHDNHEYSIGQIYQNEFLKHIELEAIYKDGTRRPYSSNNVESFIFDTISVRPIGQDKTIQHNPNDKFIHAGTYIVSLAVDIKYFVDYTFEVLDGLSDPSI